MIELPLSYRMKKRRYETSLSLRGLETLVGVSFSSLSRIESGKNPSHHSRIVIEKWLNPLYEDTCKCKRCREKAKYLDVIHTVLLRMDILEQKISRWEIGKKYIAL